MTSVGKDSEQPKMSYIAGVISIGTIISENFYQYLLKVNIHLP